MTGVELAAMAAALAFVALVVVLSIMLVKLHSTLESVKSAVEDLHRTTVPLLADLKDTVMTVNVELDRVDGIMVSAESVATSASNVAGLISMAVSNPLVKGLAFAAGLGAAARSIRGKGNRE